MSRGTDNIPQHIPHIQIERWYDSCDTHFTTTHNKKTAKPWSSVLHYERLQLYLSTWLMPIHGYLLYL